MKKNILFLVGRDDWQQDATLNLILLDRLKKNKIEILWEDPASEALYNFRQFERKLEWLPAPIKKLNLRAVQIFYGLTHPSYFLYLYKRKNISVSTRGESLKKRIRKLNIADRTIVLSRSSGGRISSLIGDELNLKHIICLGYPFKHPNHTDEPDRYLHLAHLKTPMLIIQGIDDVYGGLEIKNKYELSEKIELLFVNTNHNFNINEAMANTVVEKIEHIINGAVYTKKKLI